MSADNLAPVIIKRKKIVGGGGHHGGAWKVAICRSFGLTTPFASYDLNSPKRAGLDAVLTTTDCGMDCSAPPALGAWPT